jgi:hypothetical protein
VSEAERTARVVRDAKARSAEGAFCPRLRGTMVIANHLLKGA